MATGIRIVVGTGQHGDESPQSGLEARIVEDNSASQLSITPNGKITIAKGSTRYDMITSPEGLTIFLKFASGTDQRHVVSLFAQPKKTEHDPYWMASIDLLPVEVVPDWNRDGKITNVDRGKVSGENPWRFWVNDDDDSGETGGDDIPVAIPLIFNMYDPGSLTNRDATSAGVDGIRDLVDFFPLHFDLKAVSETFPSTQYDYYLKQESVSSVSEPGAVVLMPSLALIWLPETQLDVSPEETGGVGSYLKNVDSARTIAALPLHPIAQTGLQIPENLVTAFSQGSGIALLEARTVTGRPLVLEIRKKREALRFWRSRFRSQ